MNVLYIVNGNLKIGYGHIARSLNLATHLKKKNKVSFLLEVDCPFKSDIAQQGHIINTIPSFNNIAPSLTRIQDIITKSNIDVAIIDLVEKEYLAFNKLLLLKCRPLIVSITLFLFDENKRFEDLCIFPSLEKENKIKRLGQRSLRFVSGPEYFTFRDEFKNARNKIRPKANRVLITMGGSDPFNITLEVLKSLLNSNFEIIVLLSAISEKYTEIKDLASERHNISLITKTNKISDLFKWSDIVIINGGLTRYEACISQTPFIAISIHEKQFQITKKLTDFGVGINLGIFDRIGQDLIYKSAQNLLMDYELRLEMSKKMKGIFDLKGTERIEQLIENRLHETKKNNTESKIDDQA